MVAPENKFPVWVPSKPESVSLFQPGPVTGAPRPTEALPVKENFSAPVIGLVSKPAQITLVKPPLPVVELTPARPKVEEVKPVVKDMSFLGIDLKGIATKLAPKLIAATAMGSESNKELLKSALSSPVFSPVYKKFGSDLETGAKVAASVVSIAGGAAALGASGDSKAGQLVSNFLPASDSKGTGAGAVLGRAFDALKKAVSPKSDSGSSSWVPWVIGGLALLFFFGKKLFK